MQELRWPTYALRDLVLDAAVPDERGALRIRDVHGREYLDAVNGIGCAPLGHGHARWVAALHAQMLRLGAAANSFTTGPQQRFAAAIAARMPIRDARVFLAARGPRRPRRRSSWRCARPAGARSSRSSAPSTGAR